MRAWDLVLEVSEQLAEAGVTTPAADARWLVCHALKCDSTALVLRDASPGDRDKVAGFVARRRTGEPVQHITGWAPFRYETLAVGPGVFIPRPETEELVDWILQECSTVGNVLDICTGSGCIAVCLAKYLKEAKVSALDISSEAIGLARENALNHRLDIVFYQKDIMATDSLWQKFDLIVANPPYVTLNEKVDMMPNVLDYEPSLALFVDDEDPLIFYRTIARFAQKNLVDDGMLFFEINRKFGKETVDLLASMGFVDIVPKKDISGNDRFIKCKTQLTT